MKFRQTALTALTLAAFSLCSSVSHGQELLRWKLERGETLKYTMQQKMDTSVTYGGNDQVSTMNQRMGMVWNVQQVGASGEIVMTQVLDRIQLKMQNPQSGAIEVDTAAPAPADNPLVKSMADSFSKLVNKEFTVTMNPTGKVENVSIPPELLEAISGAASGGPAVLDEETLKQMMRQTAVTLPEQPVSPGDSWTTSQTMELPFGTMKMSPTMTYRGREADTNLAIIDFVPTVTLEPKAGTGVNVSLKTASGAGRVKFDVDKGRIQSTQMQLTMQLVTESQGQKFEPTIKQVMSLTLTP